MRITAIGIGLLVALSCAPVCAQTQPAEEGKTPVSDLPEAPKIPTKEEVYKEQQEEIPAYIPLPMNFRIGLIGDHEVQIDTTVGPQKQIKTPLILVNPANGSTNVYAKNFPARIAAVSPNGSWMIGIVPSASVEHSSGSSSKECAVSLNLVRDEIKLIVEFPIHSNFQALFPPDVNDKFYYCVNEPGAVNAIVSYSLTDGKSAVLPADGNRFYLYGVRTAQPRGLWVQDPLALGDSLSLALLGLDKGEVITTADFPGVREVYAQPGGENLLASVLSGAEASVGYFKLADNSFHQVPQLVLTRPSFRWAHKGLAVIAKESTSTRDRFIWIDLATGQVRELFSGYFKVDFWDISPGDEALVFITAAKGTPVLFVVPLDPTINVVNRIRLTDASNISWLGCMNPPPSGSRGSWLDRLLPF